MSNASFRSLLGDSSQSDGTLSGQVKTFQQEFDNHCSLTKKQRLWGFCICFATGWGLSIGALLALANLTIFAVLYSLGSVCALLATLFVFGPMAQLKSMFKPIRAGATIIYLATIVTTLVFAFVLQSAPLVLFSLAIQFCAMIWYTASYVPYGRKMIKKMIGGVCKSVMNEP